MLHEEVDQLGGVLHEVNILVHGPVHDEQPALLLRQLAHEVEDGAELVAVGLEAGPVQVALGVSSVVQLPRGHWGPGNGHLIIIIVIVIIVIFIMATLNSLGYCMRPMRER